MHRKPFDKPDSPYSLWDLSVSQSAERLRDREAVAEVRNFLSSRARGVAGVPVVLLAARSKASRG